MKKLILILALLAPTWRLHAQSLVLGGAASIVIGENSGGGGGSGTVTSVACGTFPSWMTCSVGSTPTVTPVITVGTDTQSANTFLRGPTSGSAAIPSFGALVSADIPNNAANTTGTSGGLSGTPSITIASLVMSGTFTLTGTANGCATWASGVLGSTGIACGSGGGGTGFSALTPGTNTNAGSYIFGTGTSLSTTGGATIAATSAPYSGLTGSPPTWNQNTTGTASNLSGTPGLPNGTTATTQTTTDTSTKLANDIFVHNVFNAGVSGTANSYALFSGANVVGNGSLQDNGTTVSTTEIFSAAAISTGAPTVLASLPTCNSGAQGTFASITDSTTQTWGATVTGGGSDFAFVGCDGTNYTVIGK